MPRFSISARLKSFVYAFRGLIAMVKEEHNFHIHLVAAFTVIIAGFWLQVSRTDWRWLAMAIGLVLVAEIFNTAIEKLVDLKQPEQDPKAGKIKDLAAAAVLLASFMSAIIGALVFWPYLQAL